MALAATASDAVASETCHPLHTYFRIFAEDKVPGSNKIHEFVVFEGTFAKWDRFQTSVHRILQDELYGPPVGGETEADRRKDKKCFDFFFDDTLSKAVTKTPINDKVKIWTHVQFYKAWDVIKHALSRLRGETASSGKSFRDGFLAWLRFSLKEYPDDPTMEGKEHLITGYLQVSERKLIQSCETP